MTERIAALKTQLEGALRDESQPGVCLLKAAEEKFGVDRLYILVGMIGCMSIWLVFGFAAQLICNLFGFVLPAYFSIQAVESADKADDTKWLTYWVIFAFFSVIEYFVNAIVNVLPLYWLLKSFFLIWLINPTDMNGSEIIYNKLIKRFLLKKEE